MKNRLIALCCVGCGLMTSLVFGVEKPTGQGFGSVQVITESGGINLSGTDGDTGLGIVDAAGGVFNWVLGIMGLIALLIVVRGGLRMVTAAGDEQRYGDGFTTLKNAAIGLVIIGLARFIVSLFFWITNLVATDADEVGPAGTFGMVMIK